MERSGLFNCQLESAHDSHKRTRLVQWGSLTSAMCLVALVSGCSRLITLQIKNNYKVPVEVYDASFVSPATPVLLGTVPANGAVEYKLQRLSGGGVYHIQVCKIGGVLLQDVVRPTDKINASNNGLWKLDVKP